MLFYIIAVLYYITLLYYCSFYIFILYNFTNLKNSWILLQTLKTTYCEQKSTQKLALYPLLPPQKTMATTVAACNASAQMLIKTAQEGNIIDVLDKETINALVKALKHSQKPAKKSSARDASHKKSIERADLPFNPKCCAARQFVLACHPCDEDGKSPQLYRNVKSEGQEHHYGLLNVQCSKTSLNSDGLCSHHADTTKKSSDAGRCHQTGELFLGLYNKDKPENPVRISNSGTTHHYIWIENVPEDIQQNHTKKKSNTKKKVDATEKYEDRNWLADLNSGDIDEFLKPRLQLYSKHHNLPTHDDDGKVLKKPQLLDAVKKHIHEHRVLLEEQGEQDEQDEQDEQEEQVEQEEQDEQDEQQNNNVDEELTQEENAGLTWTTPDGVIYDLEHGELYDQESGEKVGELSDTAAKGWTVRKESIMIHAANIAKKMEDAM